MDSDRKSTLKVALMLAMFFAVMGWIITARSVILFLDAQHPFTILVIWYGAVFAPLLYFFGRMHFGNRFGHHHVFATGMLYLGIGMIYLAFSIIFYFPSSGYVNEQTGKPASNILLGSEDGVIYAFVEQGVHSAELAKVITYILLPAGLIFGGVMILHPKSVKQVGVILFGNNGRNK